MSSFSEEYHAAMRRGGTKRTEGPDEFARSFRSAFQSGDASLRAYTAPPERVRRVQQDTDLARRTAGSDSPPTYRDGLTELARRDAAKAVAERDARRYSDPLTGMARKAAARAEPSGASAGARSGFTHSSGKLDDAPTYGIGKVPPGTPGGGGRGYSTTAREAEPKKRAFRDEWRNFWDDLKPSAVLEGSRQYQAEVSKRYTDDYIDPEEAAAFAFFKPALSVGEAIARSFDRDFGDEESHKNMEALGSDIDATLKKAHETQPFFYGAGSLLGSLTLMNGISSGVAAIPGFEALPALAKGIISGATSRGGMAFLNGIGAVSQPDDNEEPITFPETDVQIHPTNKAGDFAREVISSAIGGAVGGGAAAGVNVLGNGLLNSMQNADYPFSVNPSSQLPGVVSNAASALQRFGLEHNTLARTIVAGLSGMSFAGGDVNAKRETEKLLGGRPEKMSAADYYTELLLGFGFGAMSYLAGTYSSTRARQAAEEGAEAYRAAQTAAASGDKNAYAGALAVLNNSAAEINNVLTSGVIPGAEAAEAAEIINSVVLEMNNTPTLPALPAPSGNLPQPPVNDTINQTLIRLAQEMSNEEVAQAPTQAYNETNEEAKEELMGPNGPDFQPERRYSPAQQIIQSGQTDEKQITANAPDDGNATELKPKEGASNGNLTGEHRQNQTGTLGAQAEEGNRPGVQSPQRSVPGNAGKESEGISAYGGRSAAEEAAESLKAYGAVSHIIDGKDWTEKASAVTRAGDVYMRSDIPEEERGMIAPHEGTHIMKQARYAPYLEFVDRTPEMMDSHSEAFSDLLQYIADKRGIDPFTLANDDILNLYDEVNATIYGHIAAGKVNGDLINGLHHAFKDFDSYIAELEGIHTRFKRGHSGGVNDTQTEAKQPEILEVINNEQLNSNEREETPREFRERWRGKGNRTGKVGKIVYAYHEAAGLDTSLQSERARDEFGRLGIPCFIHQRLEYNQNGITRQVTGEAASIGGEIVGINAHASADGITIAGHEAFHFWRDNLPAERAVFMEHLKNSVDYMSDEFSILAGNIEKAYFAVKPWYAKDAEAVWEEVGAWISGNLHSGKQAGFLRNMLNDYDEVKAEWDQLVSIALQKNQDGNHSGRRTDQDIDFMAAFDDGDPSTAQFSDRPPSLYDLAYAMYTGESDRLYRELNAMQAARGGPMQPAPEMARDDREQMNADPRVDREEESAPELPVDYLSILDLGYGPVSASRLRDLLMMGEVEQYVKGGRIRFRRANQTE